MIIITIIITSIITTTTIIVIIIIIITPKLEEATGKTGHIVGWDVIIDLPIFSHSFSLINPTNESPSQGSNQFELPRTKSL